MFIDVDFDHVGMAAHRAVFDIRLAGAFGQIQWDDDHFAARIAQIAGFCAQGELFIGFGDSIG